MAANHRSSWYNQITRFIHLQHTNIIPYNNSVQWTSEYSIYMNNESTGFNVIESIKFILDRRYIRI